MSDSDEDRTISYGTPLDPYEEDEVPSKRKFQPADQYAVDDHGRRRFHGAFTGGFSAGFGNTVGSQEGWTPATFKSSRSEKAMVSNQRPEDFMDDEDRGDYGIAPRQIQTHSEFSGQRASKRAYHDGPIPGEPVLDQLLRVVHETAAVRMLKAMGWRPGQGAGDRLTREQKRKARDQQKVYGCYVPPEMRQQTQSDEESTDSEYDYDTLFAPDDYEPYILSRKNDRFGLGYQGLSRHSVLGNLVGEYGSDATSSKSHLVMKEKGKKVSIRGQAFGVGAFEADDEDIYAREDMSHYDFTLGGPAPQATKAKVKRDGRVLEGFLPASKPPPPLPSFPPPALPRDYVPAAAGTRRSRFEPVDAPQRDQGLGRHELTAEARGALLGEKPVPKIAEEPQHTTIEPNKPLPDDIIAKITGRNVAFVSKEDIPGKTVDFIAQESSNTPDFISIKDSGKELKNVFKPFASNPLKQKRYENFLENRSSVLDRDGDVDKVTEWEREREMLEFEQAAKLYRPLSGVMGDRFTHASQPDDALNPLTAVTKSSTNHGSATQEQIEAASKGVYGAGTRSKVEWRPEGVVCKRFNVPEPGVTRSEPKSKNDKQKVSYSIFSYLESSVHDKDSFAKEQSTFSGSKSLNRPLQTNIIQKEVITPEKPKIPENVDKDTNNSKTIVNDTNKTNIIEVNKPKITAESIQNDGRTKRMTVAELFLKESEKNKAKGEEVTETINSFDKMDLYKSIFLSDSEEEAFETSTDTKNDKTTNVSTVNDFVDAPKNVLRNTSPPRGIFANIDFDEINSWKRTDDKPETSQKDTNNKEKSTENNIESMDTEIYGPKIPENLIKRLESSENNSNNNVHKDVIHEIDSSSSDSWVDANAVKSKKKKKKLKSKKDKFRHKKKKHKKKDR